MKNRLDVILVKKGLAPSREKARAVIMSGNVFISGQREDKAGALFEEDGIELYIKENPLKYVSRGGLKLEKAVKFFKLKLSGLVCLDIGASTGGFTDVMLKEGAKRVYSVDVGYGQLDYSLRTDSRVICMEKTNFRYMEKGDIPEEIDFAACDVSFISLSKILPPAFNLLKDQASLICLIKPQFEAGKDKVGKKGVVRDKKVHSEVIRSVIDMSDETGFKVEGLSYSPVKGPEGNIEYLIHLRKAWKDIHRDQPGRDNEESYKLAEEVIEQAHEELSHSSK